MLSLFATVLDYRQYPLAHTTAIPTEDDFRHIPRIKYQGEWLHRSLEPFAGFAPVKQLSFLSIVTSSCRALGKSENVAVGSLAYLLYDDAKEAYDAQLNLGTATSPLQAT